jgi:hypothetical protein
LAGPTNSRIGVFGSFGSLGIARRFFRSLRALASFAFTPAGSTADTAARAEDRAGLVVLGMAKLPFRESGLEAGR